MSHMGAYEISMIVTSAVFLGLYLRGLVRLHGENKAKVVSVKSRDARA